MQDKAKTRHTLTSEDCQSKNQSYSLHGYQTDRYTCESMRKQ